jgi:hypothetical protein
VAVPETGQHSARELRARATSSEATFRLDADVAHNLATACDRLVDDLRQIRRTGNAVTTVTGFPDLPSGRALARGFGDKGHEFLDTLVALQQTALLFKAAYLTAGRQFTQAEEAGRAALDLVAARLDDTLRTGDDSDS